MLLLLLLLLLLMLLLLLLLLHRVVASSLVSQQCNKQHQDELRELNERGKEQRQRGVKEAKHISRRLCTSAIQ